MDTWSKLKIGAAGSALALSWGLYAYVKMTASPDPASGQESKLACRVNADGLGEVFDSQSNKIVWSMEDNAQISSSTITGSAIKLDTNPLGDIVREEMTVDLAENKCDIGSEMTFPLIERNFAPS